MEEIVTCERNETLLLGHDHTCAQPQSDVIIA